MPEWVAFCGLVTIVFIVVFALMVALGPPPGFRCTDGKEHDYGPWEFRNSYGTQHRKCTKCGWHQIS